MTPGRKEQTATVSRPLPLPLPRSSSPSAPLEHCAPLAVAPAIFSDNFPVSVSRHDFDLQRARHEAGADKPPSAAAILPPATHLSATLHFKGD